MLPDIAELRWSHTDSAAEGPGEVGDTVETAFLRDGFYGKGGSGEHLFGLAQTVIQQIVVGCAAKFLAKAADQVRLADHAQIRQSIQIDFFRIMGGDINHCRLDRRRHK